MDVMIPLDRDATSSLANQIYTGLRGAIISNRIPGGARLPSTRDLARQLGVARFTVDDAYARLAAEEYVVGKRGSGTYVIEHSQLADQIDVIDRPVRDSRRQLSAWSQRVLAMPDVIEADVSSEPFVSFETGRPTLEEFPWTVWQRLLNREARDQPQDAYTYSDPAGLEDLRVTISQYLARSRGLDCAPDEVVVTSGFQQSLDVVTRMFVDPGDDVLIEDPCYPRVRKILAAAGGHVKPVPVDGDGLRVEQLPRGGKPAKLLYTTPSHQYPTGAILSLQKRLDLLAWSDETGSVIVEDDYDGELRYDARPVPPLAGLARERNAANNVIYAGSFSKVLFPALRLGYAVLPRDLVAPYLRAKEAIDRHAPTLLQSTVTAMIREGYFERHLTRMRRLYASRQTALVDAIERHLAGIAFRDVETGSAGLHLLVRMAVNMSEQELLQRAADHGIQLDGASHCFAIPPPQPHLLLGFAAVPEDRIAAGIERLAHVLNANA